MNAEYYNNAAKEFLQTFNQYTPLSVLAGSMSQGTAVHDINMMRHKYHDEEWQETLLALNDLGRYSKHIDLWREVIDGLADELYVMLGTLSLLEGEVSNSQIILNPYVEQLSLRSFNAYSNLVQVSMDIESLRVCSDWKLAKSKLTNSIADLHYIAANMGINLPLAFKAVHESNMTKVCYRMDDAQASANHYKSIGLATETTHQVVSGKDIWVLKALQDTEIEGKQYYKGKVLKPLTWKAPDFSELLNLPAGSANASAKAA